MIDHASYRARRTFGSLDALRAFSILAVIWHHTAPEIGNDASTRGFLGVDLFFVLSGFLIVTLLLRERDASGDISLKNFYIRRSLRIFPIYYLLLGALALAFAVKPNSKNAAPFFEALPYYLTYTSNWVSIPSIMSISWSLAAEEQFYLFWPPVEKFLRKYWLIVFIAGVVVMQLINFGLFWRRDLPILQATFTPILFGVALAHLLHTKKGYDFAAKIAGHRWSSVIALIGVLGCVILPAGDIAGGPRLAIHVSMVLLLASVVVREDHVLAPLLQLRVLTAIGAVSYGMYLYHMLLRFAVFAAFDRVGVEATILRFLATAIATFIVAELSYRFIEKPFLRLKERFSAKTQPSEGQVASTTS